MSSSGVLAFLLIVLVGGAAALFYVGAGSMETIRVEGLSGSDDEDEEAAGEEGDHEGLTFDDIEAYEDVLNVLVVGSDRRDDLDPEAQAELGTGDEDGDRTDTIMLVRVDPADDDAQILSFPRDLLVTRCDGSRGKINGAYAVGEMSPTTDGPSCLVQTITDWSGLRIDHYVEVDFSGFIEVVDIVGGVPVYLEHELDDWRANLDLEPGCHRLEGVEALGFVRTRKYDSDYGRVARQQRFVKEFVDEAASLSTALNPPRLFSLVDTAASAVTVDDGMTFDKMRRVAASLRDLAGDDVAARTVPGDYQVIDGIDYEVPYEDLAHDLFRAFERGLLHEQDDDDLEPEAVEVADVPSLDVLNAAGIGGLAAEVAEALAAAGFQVGEVANSDEQVTGGVEVHHPLHLAAEAELVAEAIPGAEAVAVDGAQAMEVHLGSDVDVAAIGIEAEPEEPAGADEPAEPEGPAEADEPEVAEAPEEGEDVAVPDDIIGSDFVGAGPVPDVCFD